MLARFLHESAIEVMLTGWGLSDGRMTRRPAAPRKVVRGDLHMLKTIEVHTTSEEDTYRLGRSIGEILKPEDVILLLGDLGTGKTRLAKGIVSAATGVDPEEVVSPSFTLVNRFEGPFPVHHADLYRIEADQVDDIGLDEALAEEGALIIEWAEKMPNVAPDSLQVVISYSLDPDSRRIILRWPEHGSWDERIGTVAEAWSVEYCAVSGT